MKEPSKQFIFQLPDSLRERFMSVYTGRWLAEGIREAMEAFINERQSPGIGDSEGPG